MGHDARRLALAGQSVAGLPCEVTEQHVEQLVLVRKLDDGRITTRQMLPVAFVPLTGGHD